QGIHSPTFGCCGDKQFCLSKTVFPQNLLYLAFNLINTRFVHAIGFGLLLDEPSLGLAPIIIQQIFDTIEQLREQGMTIFLVEQNANQALKLADRGYVLENGHVVLSDTGDALLANEAVRSAYLGG
ncbi:hypothetical protein ACVWC5_25030, partial [Escherichia coli]